jgi:hypothetical protein
MRRDLAIGQLVGGIGFLDEGLGHKGRIEGRRKGV